VNQGYRGVEGEISHKRVKEEFLRINKNIPVRSGREVNS
jgi:hypothetical protein